jgi:hypothetical protein
LFDIQRKRVKKTSKDISQKKCRARYVFYEKQNKLTKSKLNTKRNITHKKIVKTGKLLSATLL